jgi:hypothetical protein
MWPFFLLLFSFSLRARGRGGSVFVEHPSHGAPRREPGKKGRGGEGAFCVAAVFLFCYFLFLGRGRGGGGASARIFCGCGSVWKRRKLGNRGRTHAHRVSRTGVGFAVCGVVVAGRGRVGAARRQKDARWKNTKRGGGERCASILGLGGGKEEEQRTRPWGASSVVVVLVFGASRRARKWRRARVLGRSSRAAAAWRLLRGQRQHAAQC